MLIPIRPTRNIMGTYSSTPTNLQFRQVLSPPVSPRRYRAFQVNGCSLASGLGFRRVGLHGERFREVGPDVRPSKHQLYGVLRPAFGFGKAALVLTLLLTVVEGIGSGWGVARVDGGGRNSFRERGGVVKGDAPGH